MHHKSRLARVGRDAAGASGATHVRLRSERRDEIETWQLPLVRMALEKVGSVSAPRAARGVDAWTRGRRKGVSAAVSLSHQQARMTVRRPLRPSCERTCSDPFVKVHLLILLLYLDFISPRVAILVLKRRRNALKQEEIYHYMYM